MPPWKRHARRLGSGEPWVCHRGRRRCAALTGRSASRADQDLIGANIEQVEIRLALVQDAGSTIRNIVGAVERVTDIIAEISASAAEQSKGIGDVNSAVTQLDR